jgi:penicillin-insensitive murein endopeptidase
MMVKKHIAVVLVTLFAFACNESVEVPTDDIIVPETVDTTFAPLGAQEVTLSEVEEYYLKHADDFKPSTSLGTPGKGSLENAKLMPFSGPNFQYFDTLSYTEGRAFTNGKTRNCLLDAYKQLQTDVPSRTFFVMECSTKRGGKLWPHRTHQNGLSVDFMMPLTKSGQPFVDLDTIGAKHYFLSFNKSGLWMKDQSVSIDFDLVAQHILELHNAGEKNGLGISKVIINTDLKPEFYATPHGQIVKDLEIYVVKSLTPTINALHDDHYHIDFVEL